MMKSLTEKTEWLFTKEADGYQHNENNYAVPHELTLTITLNEYRSLLIDSARSKLEIDKANTARWDAEKKVKQLEKELVELKAKYLESIIDKKGEADE